jgi:ubiquinone/menaquinone biosynthesis C-methylase UbiE
MPQSLMHECSAPTRGRTLDYAASVYDALSPLMTFGHEKHIGRMVLQRMNLKGHERILDVGCGTGTLTIEAGRQLSAKTGGTITGIDAAVRMVRLARKKADGCVHIRFDVAAAERLPYAGESFDLAMSTFFFHHVDMELKVIALNEMWRVLKDGGTALIADVDTPTTLFGKVCAWSGYLLFQQDQIKENIQGRLKEAMRQSRFGDYTAVSSHLGYVTLFELRKKELT